MEIISNSRDWISQYEHSDSIVEQGQFLTDQELQERDERIAREAFKAGQINGIRIGFENAKESEWRKEEGGEYLRDKYESVEDLLKEVE